MKKTLITLVAGMILASCTQYTCPTYGTSYSYTPPKKQSVRSAGKSKPTKRAEID